MKNKQLEDAIDNELQSIYYEISVDTEISDAIIEYCHLHKQEIAVFVIERENE